MSVLYIEGLSKRYKHHTALEPFSLQAKKGECIVLCGGNGAGKSTLLHMLAGISSPSAGTVRILEIDLKKQRNEYVRHIGYMPDAFYAQEMMTVREFLHFYAALRKCPANQVKEALQLIGLHDKERERVGHLSKGMKQRLLFGQALLGKPDVLLLDEPTNGLDPYWMNQFIKIIKAVKNEGTIVVFSTHMMDVAAEVGDFVIFLEEGKILHILQNPKENVEHFTWELLQLYRKKEEKLSNSFPVFI
ncbi:MAG: ABC transporter ATP-binding protein [Ectobacillus sp.]